MAAGADRNESLDALIAAFDPRDPAFRSDPYPVYHDLRRHSPIHHRPQRNDWIVTRYDDVAALAKDTRLCGFGDVGRLPVAGAAGTSRALSRFLASIHEREALRALWLVNRNPPDHTRLRKLMHRMFAPASVAALRERIEAMTNRSLDRVEAGGDLDIIADFSRPLSIMVIGDILGIPEDARPAVQRLAGESTLRIDLDPTLAASERGLLGLVGLTEYFRDLIAAWDLRGSTQPSLIGVLLQAQAEGKLSAAEILAQCSFTVIAGYATTQHLIGNGVLALLRHPDQLDLLRRQPALIDGAVEEVMRYDTPAQVSERVAAADVEIGGHRIRKGQGVHLVLGAANRDPAVFRDPDRFDITRDPNPHLSFGYGIHHCLGAALARSTAQIAIGTLVRRRPRLRLQTDGVAWGENYLMHGLTSLPVVFD